MRRPWLALLLVLCILAAAVVSVVQLAATSTRTASPGSPHRAPARAGVKVYRYALTWQVTAFMGLQSLLYYAALSWLPTIFQDRGDSAVTAGNLLALMGVGNLATSLIVPVLAHRLLPTVEATMSGRSPAATLAGLVASTPVPSRASS